MTSASLHHVACLAAIAAYGLRLVASTSGAARISSRDDAASADLNPRPGVARWTLQRPCSFLDVDHRSTRLRRPCHDPQRPHTSSSRFCRRGALVGAPGVAAVVFARQRDLGELPHRLWTAPCRHLTWWWCVTQGYLHVPSPLPSPRKWRHPHMHVPFLLPSPRA